MKVLGSILKRVESVSEWTGKVIRWLVVLLILAIVYEVFARYLFNAPTRWSFDISYMLGGSLYVLGFAYVLYHKRNIRVDVFYTKFNPRTKLILDLLAMLVFFFPLVYFILMKSIDQTLLSWRYNECSSFTVWQPPIYYFRTVISIGLLLWLTQGVATLLRDILEFIGKPAND